MKKMIVLCGILILLVKVNGQPCEEFEPSVYYDTYHEYYNRPSEWNLFNVHDPTVCKDGEWYYMYNTDVGMGYNSGTGAMKRRSKDLTNWEYLGHAFPDGIPQSAKDYFLTYNPSYSDEGIWAPYLLKYKNKYILYYSAPGGLSNQPLAYIGYATCDSANGPWVDQGKITGSIPGDNINAIDPTVIYDSINKQLWMAYGSWETGIYVLELDTATGGIKSADDRGVKIAARTGGEDRGIEGGEIFYRNGWYYLIVSYDWLEDKYNLRVGRSKTPNGPYLDFNGKNMAEYSDNLPMIMAPYKFKNHVGWIGTGHCGVFNDGNGKYYIVNQARPYNDIYNMVGHIREIYFINGWPVLSPERYTGMPQCPDITEDTLVGSWEYIYLSYNPSADYISSTTITLNEGGVLNTSDSWKLNGDTLIFTKFSSTDTLLVSWQWDWENECKTIVFTGINEKGYCSWGKKINSKAVENFTSIISGGTYTIMNNYSHKFLQPFNNKDINFVAIVQKSGDGSDAQLWRIRNSSELNYYNIGPMSSDLVRVAQVKDGSGDNGKNIQLGGFDDSDKQKFRIMSLGNGYYKILTKVSNNASAFDVLNFSISDNGSIIQWSYLSGNNQMWKIKRVDSIAIDNTKFTAIDDSKFLNTDIMIYPNPSNDGSINIILNNVSDEIGNLKVSVIDLRGIEVYKLDQLNWPYNDINIKLNPGLYLINLTSEKGQRIEKIIIN